jgi:TolA-binding protein
MKYLYVILSLIAAFLAVISFRLVEAGTVLKQNNEISQMLIKVNQSKIYSDQRLEEAITNLRKQIVELGEKVLIRK